MEQGSQGHYTINTCLSCSESKAEVLMIPLGVEEPFHLTSENKDIYSTILTVAKSQLQSTNKNYLMVGVPTMT